MAGVIVTAGAGRSATGETGKPETLIIRGDDIVRFAISAMNQGVSGRQTPAIESPSRDSPAGDGPAGDSPARDRAMLAGRFGLSGAPAGAGLEADRNRAGLLRPMGRAILAAEATETVA